MSTSNGHLTREQIIGALDLPVQKVEVPEWGGPVYLRSLTARERFAFAATLDKDKAGAAERLVALALSDAEGTPLGISEEDIGKKHGKVVGRLADIVVEMNMLSQQAVETVKGNS